MERRKISSLVVEAPSLLALFKKEKPSATNLDFSNGNDPEIPSGDYGPSIIFYYGKDKSESQFVNISQKVVDELDGNVTLQMILQDFPVYAIPVYVNEKNPDGSTKRNNKNIPIRATDENGKWIERKSQVTGKALINYTLGLKGAMNIHDLDLGMLTKAPEKVPAGDEKKEGEE